MYKNVKQTNKYQTKTNKDKNKNKIKKQKNKDYQSITL